MSSVSDISHHISELWDLVISYIKNQTIVPLKRLLRYFSFGIAGSVLMAMGIFLLSLGFLRYLQTLSSFNTTFSFAPYLLVSLADVCVVGILFFVMTRPTLIKPRPPKKGRP